MPPAYLRAPSVKAAPVPYAPGCTGKIPQTEAEARATMQRRRSCGSDGADGAVYQCLHCGAWHTTKTRAS